MTNPLLEFRLDAPFHRIKADHIVPAVDALLSSATDALNEIVAVRGQRTYQNTLFALEEATRPLEWAMAIVGHLEAVATTPELRTAYNTVKPRVSEFYSQIPLNSGLYQALVEFQATDEGASLTGANRRLLEKTLREFRRHGAELDPSGKKELSEIDVELSTTTTRYAQNVLDATAAWELILHDDTRLSGLPESAREGAKEAAAARGITGYRFTLQAPSVIAALTYLDDAALRETIWRAYNSRATDADHDNRSLVRRILELRKKKAALLGYDTFGDLVLEERMAKNAAGARAFVDKLRDETAGYFERENTALLEFRRSLEGTDAKPLKAWDVAYYSEKLRRSQFDFDEEELRQYLPAEHVLRGMFAIVGELYGIDIRARDHVETWHPEVRSYSVYTATEDPESERHLGNFYVDLFPRDNKRGGAWMMGLHTGVPPEPHVGLFCANVTPAVGSKPPLLTHREVETLFHEFGHLMHHLLSEVPVRSLGGTNVAWDFVELPSQIMENWCWQRDALDRFARHWKTGEAIPDALFNKMLAARTFRAANAQMRQLGFATVDLALHADWPDAVDPIAFGTEILKTFAPTPLPEDYALLASFAHVFASPVGYATGYYSYKWAEVLDADAFTRFQHEGVFNREVGTAFRKEILARGDSADPSELFRNFLGRDPNPEALQVRQGLRAQPVK